MSDLASDYIVVGGGLAGRVIASCLSCGEGEPEVTLIEAGLDPAGRQNTGSYLCGLSLLGGEPDYAYQSEPVGATANRIHILNAGNMLGGGSGLNFGGWLLADSQDYDHGGQVVSDKRWSYEGLKLQLKKAESKCNARTVSNDAERKYPLRDIVKAAWSELAVQAADMAKGSVGGILEMLENSRDEARQTSNAVYILDYVKVPTNCVVHRVMFSATVATGVILADGTEIKAKREVILSAGTT